MAFNNSSLSTVIDDVDYEYIERFYKIYGGFLLFIGVPCNILSGFIMGTDQSNRLTTRILMTLLSLSDTAVLLTAVLRYWFMQFFKIDVRTFGWFSCKLHFFCSAISSDFAVGTLCSLAVERFLVVAFPHKANQLVTVKSVVLGMMGLFLGLAAKNSVNFWFQDLIANPGKSAASIIDNDENVNGRSLISENVTLLLKLLSTTTNSPQSLVFSSSNSSSSSLMTTTATSISRTISYSCKFKQELKDNVRIFSKFDYISYAVLPYCILFSCNVYIYAVLRRQGRLLTASRTKAGIRQQNTTSSPPDDKKQNGLRSRLTGSKGSKGAADAAAPKRRKRKPENVVKVLTALTVIHIITTLPGTTLVLLKTYFNFTDNLSSSEAKRFSIIRVGLILLMFTNNATNFFAYLKSSTGFRERVFKLMCCCVAGFRARFDQASGTIRRPAGVTRADSSVIDREELAARQLKEPLTKLPDSSVGSIHQIEMHNGGGDRGTVVGVGDGGPCSPLANLTTSVSFNGAAIE